MDEPGKLPELTSEERAAMDSLPSDAVDHWWRGEKWVNGQWVKPKVMMSKRTPHLLRGMADAEEHAALAKILYGAADEIDRLRKRQAGFSSDIFAACLECHDYDAIYLRIMNVLEEYGAIRHTRPGAR